MAKYKVSEVLNMTLEQFNRLTESEAKDMVNSLRGEVNRITKAMRAEDIKSPAYYGFQKSGGKAYAHLRSTKNMNRGEALAELNRGMRFLNAKTGSVAGAAAHKTRVLQNLGLPSDTDSKTASHVYDVYSKLQEENPAVFNETFTKYRELKAKVGAAIKENKSPEEISKIIEDEYKNVIKERNQLYGDMENGLSNAPKI